MIRSVVTRSARVAVFAALAVSFGGCLATVSQLDEVHDQVNVTRAEAAASDSVRALQLVQILSTLRALNDSIAAVNLRLTRLRAETQAEVRGIRQEVTQMLEATSRSEQRLSELREQVERRARQTPPPSPDGSTVDAGPGPDELLRIGRDQLLRGSASAARAALNDLLTRYPTSELASEAQFYLAESHAADGATGAADSAYAAVVSRYPSSPRAATSLYKRGVLAQTAGRRTVARRLYNDLITQYPSSDEAELARERLRVMN